MNHAFFHTVAKKEESPPLQDRYMHRHQLFTQTIINESKEGNSNYLNDGNKSNTNLSSTTNTKNKDIMYSTSVVMKNAVNTNNTSNTYFGARYI